MLDDFLAALKTMVAKLTSDPVNWGEQKYRLHHMNLLVCHGFARPLHVSYAVDEQRRIVYIKEIDALTGTPLA